MSSKIDIGRIHTMRLVRDLSWAVNSQSLLGGDPHIVAAEISALDPEQIDLRHLAKFLDRGSEHRVGRYFERLILYWLKHVRKLEIVAESLQIREGNRTIGEIDLLFRDERGRLTHWEVAVKFYLHYDQACAIGSHYIGPNAADTYEQKMQRLFAHQLPRSEKFFPEVEVRQAFIKGRIFYHPSQEQPRNLPRRLSAGHQRGVWIRASELARIRLSRGSAYKILPKPYWLSEEVLDAKDANFVSPDELVDRLASHFSSDGHALLISQFDSKDDGQVESTRMFVVPDSWPQLAKAF